MLREGMAFFSPCFDEEPPSQHDILCEIQNTILEHRTQLVDSQIDIPDGNG